MGQILGTGSRDVEILAPLKCSGILSTFNNLVSIGGSLPSTTNCLSVIGGATFGGQMLASNIKATGIIETNQIRIIGAESLDGVTIANVNGIEVAKFANDFKCRLTGHTTILGTLFCSHPIDAYRFTCTDSGVRDTAGIAIATNTGVTSIQILSNATGDVEILTPLKIKRLQTTMDTGVLINGSLECGDIKPLGSGGLTIKN